MGMMGKRRYKLPKLVIVSEGPFPSTSTGKVKKDAVRNLVLAHLAGTTKEMEPTPHSAAELAKESAALRSQL